MRTELDEAIDAWNSARDAYEDALREGGDVGGLRERVDEADGALERATGGLAARLAATQEELEPLLRSLGAAVQARVAALEHRCVEAERSATHGELAGAGYAEREQIERLEAAGASLGEVREALGAALEALQGR